MSLFDSVKYEKPCPECGEIVANWQTKEGHGGFEVIEPYEVESFYGWCQNCGAWINAVVDADVEHIINVKKCDICLTIDNERSKKPANKHMQPKTG